MSEDLVGESGNTPDKAPAAKAKAKPVEKMYDVTIDLGTSAEYITMGGNRMYHGHTYKVPLHALQSINKIMANSKQHEEVVKGNVTVVGNKRIVSRR